MNLKNNFRNWKHRYIYKLFLSKNKFWKEQTFRKSKYAHFEENLQLHLNTYCFFSKLIAEKMKKNKIKESIINIASIYGVVAQDTNIYNNNVRGKYSHMHLLKVGLLVLLNY